MAMSVEDAVRRETAVMQPSPESQKRVLFSQIDGEACVVFALSVQPRHHRTIPYHVLYFQDNYSYLLRNLSAITAPTRHIMSETLNAIDHITNAPRLELRVSS